MGSFVPAQPGEAPPPTTIPEGAYADTVPASEVDDIFFAERERTTSKGGGTVPVPMDLPEGKTNPDAVDARSGPDSSELSRRSALAAETSDWLASTYQDECADPSSAELRQAAGAQQQGFSTHHSNHVFHDVYGTDDIYAFEYYTWLGLPQNNETNQCDSLVSTNLCVWFVAGQITTTGDCGWHFGPIRDTEGALANFHTNFGYYCGGIGVKQTDLGTVPMAVWHRYRVWRLSINGFQSKWGVYRNDTYLGYVNLLGHTAKDTLQWTEIIEDDPCSTDFERVYFDNPRIWDVNLGANIPTNRGIVNYETNCSNSSWEKADGSSTSEFVKNEREKLPRVLAQGSLAWHK